MSAPSASGRWSAGDANVLSTTISGRVAPACAARSRTTSPTAAMSIDLEQRVRRRLEPDEARRGRSAPPRARPAPTRGRRTGPSTPRRRDGRARNSGTCRHRRRRRRRSPRPSAASWAIAAVAADPMRRRSRGGRPRAPPRPAPGARGSGSASGVLVAAARPADAVLGVGRASGRSAARPRRSVRPARRRRGPPGCRRRGRCHQPADRDGWRPSTGHRIMATPRPHVQIVHDRVAARSRREPHMLERTRPDLASRLRHGEPARRHDPAPGRDLEVARHHARGRLLDDGDVGPDRRPARGRRAALDRRGHRQLAATSPSRSSAWSSPTPRTT